MTKSSIELRRVSLRETFRRALKMQKLVHTYLELGSVTHSASESAHLLSDACEGAKRALRMNIEVKGTLPKEPALYVANHLSYLDPIVIASLMPCSVLAKAEVENWPWIGKLLKGLGIEFVHRGNYLDGAISLRRCTKLLHERVSILVFPEGTTTYGETVLPFAAGCFEIARVANVPVIPMTLQYATRDAAWVGDARFLPHVYRMLRKPVIDVTLHIHDAMRFEDYSTTQDLAESCRQTILQHLGDGSLSVASHAA